MFVLIYSGLWWDSWSDTIYSVMHENFFFGKGSLCIIIGLGSSTVGWGLLRGRCWSVCWNHSSSVCLVMIEKPSYGRLEKEATLAKPGQETQLQKKPDLKMVPNLLLCSVTVGPFSKWIYSFCKYSLSPCFLPCTVLDTKIQRRVKMKP